MTNLEIHTSIMQMANAANKMLTYWNNNEVINVSDLGTVQAEADKLMRQALKREEEYDVPREFDGGPDNIREEQI